MIKGLVNVTNHEIIDSKPKRIIKAKDKPIIRALSRCSGGSLSARIAMKTKLSNNTLLKFFNNELSDEERSKVGSLIDSSANYKKIISELNATYSLTAKNEKLEDNPYLYLKIINKITENKSRKDSYNSHLLKRLFQPIIALSLILITLYTGFTIGTVYSETSNELTTLNNTSAIYFNDLQHDNIETVLLIKE